MKDLKVAGGGGGGGEADPEEEEEEEDDEPSFTVKTVKPFDPRDHLNVVFIGHVGTLNIMVFIRVLLGTRCWKVDAQRQHSVHDRAGGSTNHRQV